MNVFREYLNYEQLYRIGVDAYLENNFQVQTFINTLIKVRIKVMYHENNVSAVTGILSLRQTNREASYYFVLYNIIFFFTSGLCKIHWGSFKVNIVGMVKWTNPKLCSTQSNFNITRMTTSIKALKWYDKRTLTLV